MTQLLVIGLGAFDYAFMRYAFLAGTAIALACGPVGYLLVLRGQVFTGDALGHVAFTGALAALAFGLDARLGLLVACVGVALLLAGLGDRGSAGDTEIGIVFSWVLGLGVLLLSIVASSRGGSSGAAGARVLFGSIFGLDASRALWAVAVAVIVILTLLAIARPLLFATLDEAVAVARGVPVRLLGFVFLGVAGLAAAEAAQVVGALLLLGLLATPGGAAHRLTVNPYAGLALSAALAVASVWAGLLLSFEVPSLPPSFAIMTVAAALYGGAMLLARSRAA